MNKVVSFAIALSLMSTSPIAAERTPASDNSSFDIRRYEHLINHDIGVPKPGCSLAEMGIPSRQIEGRLVDHQGQPVRDVVVAVIDPVGYSSHCYYDNFAATDDNGKFHVAGSVRKNRIVFRRNDGWVLVAGLKPHGNTLTVVWPKPATVNLTIPPALAKPGDQLTIRTRKYHAGMSAMSHSITVSEVGPTVFNAHIPGDYVITKTRMISIGDSVIMRQVEIGSFSINDGETVHVRCGDRADAAVSGTVEPAVANTYIVIEREKLTYEDVISAVDLLKPANDGFFLSGKLPQGVYVAKVMMNAAAPALGGRFGPQGPRVLKSWRFQINADSKSIRLNELPEPVSPISDVNAVLDAANQTRGRFRPAIHVARLKSLDDRAGAERELLRLLSDPGTPYHWRRFIPEILAEMTDSPKVVDGLLNAAANPVTDRERGGIFRTFGKMKGPVERFIAALEKHSGDTNHITRGICIRALGDLAVGNPDSAERIAALLEAGLEDADETTRMTAADYLGRIAQKRSLDTLLQHCDDADGPTAVLSGFGAWKISGNADHAFTAMSNVFMRTGLSGKWQAGYFLKTVAEKHEVPEEIVQQLKSLAASVGKPPFRNTYEYEVSRAGKIAQQTLDSL